MSETNYSSPWRQAPGTTAESGFFKCLAAILLVYALFSRSGAHIGIPLGAEAGLYIGDMVFLFGLVVLLLNGRFLAFLASPVALVWLCFVLWNASQTIPYLSTYGLSALRDGALWGYSLFAAIVACFLLKQPRHLIPLFRYYRWFARIYPFLIPISLAAGLLVTDDSGISLVPFKSTDALAHVVGAAAFVSCGFMTVSWFWWGSVTVDVLLMATQSRAAMVAFLGGALALWLANPRALRQGSRLIALLGLASVAALLLSFNFSLGSSERAFSLEQLTLNVSSLFETTGVEAIDSTRVWRQEWWDRIIGYSVYGPHALTGKGYGVNLAEDDGIIDYDPADPAPLRSPHNSHLTFLARAGLPGFILWLALQATWLLEMLRWLLFARRTGRPVARGLLSFLLAYWTAIMIVASTDVTLEGPMLGIWYWTLFGIGIAATRLLAQDPDVFDAAEG